MSAAVDGGSGLAPGMSGVKPGRHRSRGFTLVELVVVIGILTAAAAVLGLALRGDHPSVALQSAQGTVASVLAAARSEAALHNTCAALVVDADSGDADRYLHSLAVAELQAGAWVRTGDYVTLPQGVLVVPPTGPGPRPSSALASLTLEGKPHYALGFTALGVPDFSMFGGTGPSHQIVLASAHRPDAASIGFDNPANVRGVGLSDYGAVTFIDDSDGFP